MLSSLELRSFRNLEDRLWHPPAGAVLLLGPNGAGKTSILEAIYVLATTRSFRTADLAECVRRGAGGFALAGEFTGEQRVRLDFGWSESGGRRAVNGRTGALAEHLSVQPILAWTTADRDLLTGPPAGRRRFLDRGLVGERPASLEALTRYRQALRQKRLLLARRETGVEPWNELLAEHGAELIMRRAGHAARLAAALAERAEALDRRFADVVLTYRPSPPDGLNGAAELLRRLQEAGPGEHRRRMPLVGPHRDDMEVRWRGEEIRAASAGERKALGLLLLAAQGDLLAASGRPPLYLLDDADAELDRQALERAWQAFTSAEQVFASSNRPEVWDDVELAARSALSEGRLIGSPLL